jgi:tRNA(Ile)-lysidine synthase
MSVDCSDNRPIRPDELGQLFAPLLALRPVEPVAVAVSGGSDSTALMELFADWLRQEGFDVGQHIVLTVDHRLRPEAAAEACDVADRAAALGFQHATLGWEGEKPATGLQAAARAARYRLMGDYLRARAVGTLLTAHTRDDQAETLLMRLARGSGVDGLAGIAPWTYAEGGLHEGSRLRIVRPLLGVAKSRLAATLVARGIRWSEDPSNQSAAFERPRLRAAQVQLEALGLTGEMLALSARRLQRARTALDAVTDTLCGGPAGVVRTDPCGFFRIDRERLRAAPEEIVLRVIGRCIAAAGGSDEPVPLAKLEPIAGAVRAGEEPAGWTLARAHITADGQSLQIEREPGRLPLPVLTVAAGNRVLWDGRFGIRIAESLEGSLEVRALGSDGLNELERLGRLRLVSRSRPLRLVPSFWRGRDLVAVPTVDFWVSAELAGQVSAAFAGLRYNSRPAGGHR